MRKVYITIAVFFGIILTAFSFSWKVNSEANPLQSAEFAVGDVIFQTSNSSQSKAIQLATESQYSHCGMVVRTDGRLMVFEAVQPVKLTPINEFINRGTNGYVVKRLKESYGTFPDKEQSELQTLISRYIGKDYDIYFNWSDEELYCSELVWKIYDEYLGIELCKPRPLSDYNLSHPLVKEQLKKRYGSNLPMDEPMVSPQDLFESKLLE